MCLCLHSNTPTAAATRGTRSNKAQSGGSRKGGAAPGLSTREKQMKKKERKEKKRKERGRGERPKNKVPEIGQLERLLRSCSGEHRREKKKSPRLGF